MSTKEALVWLMKSGIIDIIAEGFDISKKRAREYLELLKVVHARACGVGFESNQPIQLLMIADAED